MTDLEARTLLAPLDFFLSLSETNLTDAFDARRVVEIEIVRRAARRATADDVDELAAMLAAHGKLLADPWASASSTAAFTPVCPRPRETCPRAPRLRALQYGPRHPPTRHQDLALIRRSLDEHSRIVRAIGAGDADGAAIAMAAHLDHIEASTRAVIDRRPSRRRNRDLRPRRLTCPPDAR